MDNQSDRVDIEIEDVLIVDTVVSTPLSIREAAIVASVAEKTIRRWVQQGRLAAEKVGGQYQIRRVDLDRALMDSSPQLMSRPASTHRTASVSTVQTPREIVGQPPMSNMLDIRPLVDHIARLEDRVQSLTEAATIWQSRAHHLEEQLKQLTAGGMSKTSGTEHAPATEELAHNAPENAQEGLQAAQAEQPPKTMPWTRHRAKFHVGRRGGDVSSGAADGIIRRMIRPTRMCFFARVFST